MVRLRARPKRADGLTTGQTGVISMKTLATIITATLLAATGTAYAFDVNQDSLGTKLVDTKVKANDLTMNSTGSLEQLGVNSANLVSVAPSAAKDFFKEAGDISQTSSAQGQTITTINVAKKIAASGNISNTAIGSLNSISANN